MEMRRVFNYFGSILLFLGGGIMIYCSFKAAAIPNNLECVIFGLLGAFILACAMHNLVDAIVTQITAIKNHE